MAFTVAIDGPAAAGKGTISQAVAQHFGFAHLDTGLLYRAVGWMNLQGQDPLAAAYNLDLSSIDTTALRTAKVGEAASKLAAIPDIRQALNEFQKSFARAPGGAVLDGRDIGTVICPNAEAKLFITARTETRAQRRFDELKRSDKTVQYAAVLKAVLERDERDKTRASAPLQAASDAHHLDTSDLTIQQACSDAITYITKIQRNERLPS